MFYLFCLRNAAQSFMRWVININTCLISELYTSVLLLVRDVMKSFVELQPVIIFIVDILSIWISRFVVLSVRKWTDDIFKHISVCVHNQKIFSFLSNYMYKNININIATIICWWILIFYFLKKWLKPINWLSEQLASHQNNHLIVAALDFEPLNCCCTKLIIIFNDHKIKKVKVLSSYINKLVMFYW